MLRINPYLQQPSSDGIYITWFTEENISSEVSITGPGLNSPLTITTTPTFEPVLSYTDAELNEEIEGLEPGSWLLGDENYKHTVDLSELSPDSTYEYSVTVGDETFESSFETAPTSEDWEEIRFVVFSDSETEPEGRVNRRDWQQGALDEESSLRPDVEGSLWAENIGVSGDRLNYPLTENVGYRNNLEIINSREPDFLVMPGDLIQGGGYQPAWDEFFRHNAGEFDSGLSEYPLIPALGNWENFGALNGGYDIDEDGRYGPLFGRQKYHVYFDTPENGTPEHQDNYYRTDYGPVTILTLDSSNGEPDDNRDNYGGEGQPPQISGQEYTGSGTDTQENITREQYEAAGGTDLADFNPGSTQWNWVEDQLESARAEGQIVFAQFHHAPYSSGTHGLPMNHEDSSGQGGTPLRQYQPLFEEYGVVAVFSGHSEMFERSFVDEDGDGEGVYYYDVGVAGDGMRGQRTDEDGNLLSYNQFSQWTADQDEPELWQEVDGVLQNVSGGKHYGHLEVNLENLGDETRITFTPVYSFPVLDENYNLIDTERRVYGDEIVIELESEINQTSSIVNGIEFLGEVNFDTGLIFEGTEVGGISGITYDSDANLFYGLSDDRGNREEPAEGASPNEPARYYDIAIDLNDGSLDEGDVTFTEVTTLLNASERPFNGGATDPEGIALAENGNLYISSEGDANNLIAPFVAEFTPDGQIIDNLPVPEKFLPTASQSSGIQNNQAFESLTITPDNQFLYTATENALFQDGERSSFESGSPARIIQYDLETKEPIAEYVYLTDAIPETPEPADGFADNGLVELLAIDNSGTLLAMERSFAVGTGNSIRIYEISTQDATDVSDVESLADADIIELAVEKRLIADLGADFGINEDNVEALTFGGTLPDGSQSLIAVSDNNFNSGNSFNPVPQTTQFLAFSIDVGEANSELENGLQPIFGTLEADIIEVEGSNNLVFAGQGNDLVDASFAEGDNRIYGDGGDDTFVLGTNDRIVGAEGADRFFTTSGGNNIITGGVGADQFWIANAELPESANVITDFTSGEDVIGIAGLGIGFEDLDIAQDGDDVLIGNESINLAILSGIDSSNLTVDNFAFA